MKHFFILITTLLPLFGMAQSYCLTDFMSSDDAEKITFYYGNNNELVAYEVFDNIDPSYPMNLRDTLLYDANGDCVKINNYQLMDGIWKHTWYIDYTYDENHNRITRENYNSFDGGITFDLGGRYEYTYEDNRLDSYVMYFGDDEFMRGQYSYNADGQLTELLETQNDLWGGTGWNNAAKTVWTYNDLGQCTRTDFYYWEYGSWVPNKNYQYEYDENGNTLVRTTYEAVGLVDRITYTYDLETAFEEVIMPNDPEGDYKWDTFVNRPLGYAWETADEDGVLQYICDYYYKYAEVEGIGGLVADINAMQLFPNPTDGLVKLNLKGIEQVEVLDMSGRTLLRQAKNNIQTVDLSSLKSGFYILKAYDGQHWNFGKIQVK